MNFIEFRESHNFMFFEAPRVKSDTWHKLDCYSEATCQKENKSNKSSSGTHVGHVSPYMRLGNPKFRINGYEKSNRANERLTCGKRGHSHLTHL